MESTMKHLGALEAAGARYVEALDGFVVEANENQNMAALVDSLTWTLARIAVGYGASGVTADILLRLGRHLGDHSERQRAQEEANQGRVEGRRTH
jgi:hypothetical protein